jgi:menaquinone-dependent protoporphyrinogen oxidase
MGEMVEKVGTRRSILIVYDTMGGTTKEIIMWIKEGAESRGASVDTKKPGEAVSLDHDIIVIGTPVYNEKPMESIISFLRKDELRNRSVALFVVCFAGVFGLKNFMVRKYLEELREECKGNVVYETSFDSAGGPWRKLNMAICHEFGKDLAGPVRNNLLRIPPI